MMNCPDCKVEMMPSSHEDVAEFWECPNCKKSFLRSELEPMIPEHCAKCKNKADWLVWANIMGPCNKCTHSPILQDNFQPL